MRGEGPAWTRVVIARSAEGNAELAAELRKSDMIPIPVDTVKFREPSNWSKVDRALSHICEFDWVAFTSPRGASIFANRMRKLGIPCGGGRPRIAVVGKATADQVIDEGFQVSFAPSTYTTAALGRQLPSRFGRRLLLLRAEKASREILAVLEERGFSVTSVSVYRTEFIQTSYRGSDVGKAKVVLLGSPSEVEGLTRRLMPSLLARLKSDALAMCIGPVTAESARRAGFKRIIVPKVHTFDALLMEVSRSVMR